MEAVDCKVGGFSVRTHGGAMDDPTTLPDRDLLAAYQRTTGEPGDPVSDRLLAEIERRGLDV